VITLGREARPDALPGTRVQNWDTDEPSERGIDGIDGIDGIERCRGTLASAGEGCATSRTR